MSMVRHMIGDRDQSEEQNGKKKKNANRFLGSVQSHHPMLSAADSWWWQAACAKDCDFY